VKTTLLAALLIPSSVFAADPSCRETAGADKAATYVDQCLQVSPATRPPCNASNPCPLIIGEIKRGCAILRASQRRPPAQSQLAEPSFCQLYLTD
jgi:hypothetical protein